MFNKKGMSWLDWTAYILITIGAINWGIYGISRLIGKPFDLVNYLFKFNSVIGYFVFIIVGLAGLYAIWTGIKLAIKKS